MKKEPEGQPHDQQIGYSVRISFGVENEAWEKIITPWQRWSKTATQEELLGFIDTLEIVIACGDDSRIDLLDESGQKIAKGKPDTFTVNIPAKFSVDPEGLVITTGFTKFRIGAGNWAEFYRPDLTMQEVLDFLTPADKTRKPRPRRPLDLFPYTPIDKPFKLWTHGHLTGLMLDTHTAPIEEWKECPPRNGYFIETRHGRAIIENCSTEGALKAILEQLGPEALQYELATLCQIEAKEYKKHGELPEYRDVTPTKLSATDLLRAMDRVPEGNTYSRETQIRPRNYLKAASLIEYTDITPTHKGNPKLKIGPVIAIVGTEFEPFLPMGDSEGGGDVISITVMPGEHAWEMIRSGRCWCHPQLLKYHPNRNKYEIAIGFYLLQLQAIRRNKEGQEYVSLATIERESGVIKFDSRDRRRLPRIEKALHQLVSDGVIGGVDGKAVIEPDPATTTGKLKGFEAARTKRLKLIVSDALPALQTKTLPSKRPSS